MLTVISHKQLQTIIHLSAEAIREFLESADPAKFEGEAETAIKAYQANPSHFSDERMVDNGADVLQAIHHPIRIEMRGVTQDGAAQVVSKGIWGPGRQEAAVAIAQKCRKLKLDLQLKLAGTSSIEFNVRGVDKSLPIHFLQVAFGDVLDVMDYQPGEPINSYVSKTVIAADGDNTIYEAPQLGVLPGLAESPVREALCSYLKAGGLFMLISGNDLNRSFKRLVDALPKEVYCRVLVAGNGGADLVYVNAKGEAVPVPDYHQKALELGLDRSHQQPLNIVYIGDDGSMEGNDYAAFKAVGFKNSVLVASEFLAGYDPGLKGCYVGGLLQGTRQYLEQFLADRGIKTRP